MDGLSARDRVELRELHQGRDRSQFTARLKELGFTKLGQRIKVEQALEAEEPEPAPEAEPPQAEPPAEEPEPAEPESPETAWRSAAAEGRRLAEIARQQLSEREAAAAASEREAEAARTAARLEQRRRRGTALADRIEEIAPLAAAPTPAPAPTPTPRPRPTPPRPPAAPVDEAEERRRREAAARELRRAQQAERALLLAEMKADRAHRAARSRRAADPPPAAAAAAAHPAAFTVQLPDGRAETWKPADDATVGDLVTWLVRRAGAADGASLLRSHALLTRATFPPSEVHLDDLAADARLADTGVFAGGGRLLLQRRLHDTPPPHDSADGGGARRRARPARRPATARPAPRTELSLCGGRVTGHLAGRYAAIDTSWHKAGMLLLIGDGGAAGEGLLERLQSSLHFLSLAVALPAVVRDASAYDASASLAAARADLIAEVLEDVRQQSGGLHLLAIVGCGGGADACLALVASGLAPRGLARLALVGGAYGAAATGALGALPPSVEVLSIHGAADEVAPLMRAQLYHARHPSHRLRTIEEGGHHFEGDAAVAAATALNDWLEGARRLNGDDIANWRLPPDEPSAATRAPPPRWAVGGEEEEEEEEIRMV